jgi:hypothetical protein
MNKKKVVDEELDRLMMIGRYRSDDLCLEIGRMQVKLETAQNRIKELEDQVDEWRRWHTDQRAKSPKQNRPVPDGWRLVFGGVKNQI